MGGRIVAPKCISAILVLRLSNSVHAEYMLKREHGLCVPDFGAGVVETLLGHRQVGDDVCVVDYAEIVRVEGHNVVGEGLVASAGRAKRVEEHLILRGELLHDIYCSEGSQGCTEGMTSVQHACCWVLLDQSAHCTDYLRGDKRVV